MLFLQIMYITKKNRLLYTIFLNIADMSASIPKISVILPFHKDEPLFNTAIMSVVEQDFPDWELLLINNNAPEAAVRLANDWADKDKRIRHIFETQQGISYALNTGLHHARAPLVARMDADDLSMPHRLSKQWHVFQAYPDIDVVSTRTIFQSSMPRSEGYALFVDWQNNLINHEDHYLSRFIESPLAHPSVMFKKSLIDAYGPYHTGPLPEDYELWLRWFEHGVRFYKVPDPLLQWNDHQDRLSRQHDNYSKEAFFTVKCDYLARYIKKDVPARKKIVVCGASKIGRKRAALLQNLGVEIYGFTDVRHKNNRQIRFIPINKLTDPGEWFLINFIAKRGVGPDIRLHFSRIGFKEGRDFILAG